MTQKYEKAFKAPINTNISKNIYAFSRSDRFQKSRQSTCKRSFYNSNDHKQMRATSFGFGSKVPLLNKEEGAPPGSYENRNGFSSVQHKRRGFSFTQNPRVTFEHMVEAYNPGPGKYIKGSSGLSKTAYSLRWRTTDLSEKGKNKVGPGQYNNAIGMASNGAYYNSKNRNSKCGKIGNGPRFEGDQTLPPGPGKYQDGMEIKKNGIYFNSRVKSLFVRSFQGTSRLPINEPSTTPGPGTYYVFPGFSSLKTPNH